MVGKLCFCVSDMVVVWRFVSEIDITGVNFYLIFFFQEGKSSIKFCKRVIDGWFS